MSRAEPGRFPLDGPVPPGTGWPGDLADRATPVARDFDQVKELATTAPGLRELTARVSVCAACPRLVHWREQVARDKRRSFAAEPFWGRPVAGWGAPDPWLLILGLAPAAHGGNRTGRIFTGDRSGDWLFAALHRVGIATRPTSTYADDGQQLVGARLVAAVRCAPPDNKPTTDERDTCAHWLDREVALVRPHLRAVVALGAYAWTAALGSLARLGEPVPRPRPAFGHGATVAVGPLLVLGAFHPSQRNTFTGLLREGMLEEVFGRALAHREAQGATPDRLLEGGWLG